MRIKFAASDPRPSFHAQRFWLNLLAPRKSPEFKLTPLFDTSHRLRSELKSCAPLKAWSSDDVAEPS